MKMNKLLLILPLFLILALPTVYAEPAGDIRYGNSVTLDFNESRQPNTEYPTLVTASVQITGESSSDAHAGLVRFQISDDNSTWSSVASHRLRHNIGGALTPITISDRASASFIVGKSQYYRINTTVEEGNPTFDLSLLREAEMDVFEIDPISGLTCSPNKDPGDVVFCSFTTMFLNATYRNDIGFNYTVLDETFMTFDSGVAENTGSFGKHRFNFTSSGTSQSYEITVFNVTEGHADTFQVMTTDFSPNSSDIADAVWDEAITGATHNDPTSAGRRLREISGSTFVIRENTAQGGTDNTITLDSGASAIDNIYDPSRVTITGGTGAGQSRLIIEYNGTSKVAVVDKDWRINPDPSSNFILNADIGGLSVNEGRLRGAATNTATLNPDASGTDDVYIGDTLFIFSGTGQDQSRIITDYDGTTRVATLNRDWDILPDNTSGYEILPLGQAEVVLFGDAAADNITAINTNLEEVNQTTQDTNSRVISLRTAFDSLDTFLRNAWASLTAQDIIDDTTEGVWTRSNRNLTNIDWSIYTIKEAP